MTWEDKYSEELLKEGYLLYRQGKIKNKVTKGKCTSVSFRDFYSPTVTVTKQNGDYEAECTCWDYRYRKCCAHVTAAIYAVEGVEQDMLTSQSIKIAPFGRLHSTDNEYHYFNIRRIAEKLQVLDSVYRKAAARVEKGTAVCTKVQQIIYRNAEGQEKNGLYLEVGFQEEQSSKKQTATIMVGKDFFWQGTCNVRRCYCSYSYESIGSRRSGAELCEHLTAGMILLEKYIREVNPGDETDARAKAFLGSFRRQRNQSTEKAENVCLEPELMNDDGEWKVGFKIGIEKLYKVRNLTDLVKLAENNETLPLGKNGALNFSLNDFEEGSKPFYQFIRNRVQDNLQRNDRIEARRSWGYYDRYAEEKITASIVLEGTALDEFYDLCREYHEIPVTHKRYGQISKKSRVKCALGVPKATVSIHELKDGRQVTGITVSGRMPDLCQGAQGVYSMDENFLYKAQQEEYEKLKPLLDMSDRNGSFSFQVGRRHLADFYHFVYPALKEISEVEDCATAQIEQYIPPVPEFVFYLDSVDNVLSCRAEVLYDEQKHLPMESRTCKQYPQIYRDYLRECEVCDTIERFFPIYDADKEESLCPETDDCYRVYKEGVDELLQLGEIRCTDRFQNRKVRKNFGIKVGVSLESDLLNLDLTATDLTKEELMAIFESYRLKKRYHVLQNGDFVDLSTPDIETINRILSACRVELKDAIGDKIKVPMYRALYLDKLLEEHEELYEHRDRNFRRLIKDFGTIKDSDFEVPASLESTLRPYQVYGHKWLRTVLQNGFGGILADEMGLGKTLQIISVLTAEKKESKAPALVVCPASLVYNWKEEFHRFAPGLSVVTVAGSAGERHKQIRNYQQVDVLITSYDLLKRDIAEYQEAEFTYQILDEAQYIKNPKTAAAKTVKVIHSKHRFALTGTPIENRLSELWSIFDFIMPGFLHDYETFRRELEIPITKEKDTDCSARLKDLIAPFVLRRLKRDVLKDLPDKIEEVRYGVMEGEQQKLYNAQILKITKQVAAESEEEFRKNRFGILAEITRTRQLCCDPSLVIENYKGGSAKREACLDLITSAIEGEHRILLFSQFTSMLDLLAEDLKQQNIRYYMLTGDTPKEERIRLMKAFNEGDVPVFLISLKAGGTGLNLTGADMVIHYDPWWNLAVQNQATDRAHRIGQTQNVTVFKLIIKDSIEEKIIKLQEAKKDLADEVLSGENGTLTGMSREELLELLR